MNTSPGRTLPANLRVTAAIASGTEPRVERKGQALGDQASLDVAERARHVHRVLEVILVGGPHQRDGHLVDDRVERVLHRLERDGIGGGRRLEVTMALR
jgi:hypothetical protein